MTRAWWPLTTPSCRSSRRSWPLVQTLPPVTRKQQLQLWQDTLQLVQGGSGTRQPAVQAGDAGAMTNARMPSS